MPATLIAEPLPLHEDPVGTIRVGGSRVTLDTVVEAYESGQSPQDHQHRDEVRGYLERREREADALQRVIEANQPPAPTRSELEARLRANRRPK
jgi:hypothetical protein